MDFHNKGVVITGAASGIGLAVARQLAARGARLLLSDIERSALDEACSAVSEAHRGAQIESFVCDVSRREDMQGLADAAFSAFESVDLVFLNAGVGVSGPVIELRHEDWSWLLGVNLWGAIHGAEAFAKRMVAQGRGGHISFNASFAGLVYSPTLGAYCVSKSGVIALAEVMRQELRSSQIGVSVVCPMRTASNIGSSGRNRLDALAAGGAVTELIDPRDPSLPGQILSVDEAATRIIDGIVRNDGYIMTHAEGRPFIRRRFEKIDAAFSHFTS